jgi:phosphoribosylformylglycinamidine synthase
VTSESGRATIMMPHPERVFRTVSNSWHPENWGEDSPWMRIFRNARKQLGPARSRERISPLPGRGLFYL